MLGILNSKYFFRYEWKHDSKIRSSKCMKLILKILRLIRETSTIFYFSYYLNGTTILIFGYSKSNPKNMNFVIEGLQLGLGYSENYWGAPPRHVLGILNWENDVLSQCIFLNFPKLLRVYRDILESENSMILVSVLLEVNPLSIRGL